MIQNIIAQFIREESSDESFITVTHVALNSSGRTAYVYCSVFPKEMEEKAFFFLKGKEGLARDAIRKKSSFKHIPHVRFLKTKDVTDINNNLI